MFVFFSRHQLLSTKGKFCLLYKIKKYYYLAGLFAIFAALLFRSSGRAEAEERALVFGGDSSFAPYSYLSDNIPSGYSVDLIKILSAMTNRNIKIKLMPWENCLSDIAAGRIDGLIGSPVNKNLEAHMSYSVPVAEVNFSIFTESSNTYVNSLKSLEGTIVGVHKDSLLKDSIIIRELNRSKRIKLLETASVRDSLEKLKNREITAFIAEKNVALYYIQKENISGIKIVGPSVGPVFEYALAVRKGNKKLLDLLNRGISALEENGTLKKLNQKWFGVNITAPFPWKMVILMTSGLTVAMVALVAMLWVISLRATVKVKTRQIQLMSQKMVEKDKLAVLGKLAGQIAHELRTPLSIMHNSLFLLRKEGTRSEEQFIKRLNVLENKIKLTSNILESILSYSRVKAQMATVISVKECLKEVLSDVEHPENIRLEVTYKKEQELTVFMDFHQFYSVLRNLIINSIQAMPSEGGKITVSAFPSSNDMSVNVRVCDTGHGIKEEAQKRVFSLFYTTKITGTGLGLSISKSIIETNGGKLVLESSSSKGTCFMITLPSPKGITNER